MPGNDDAAVMHVHAWCDGLGSFCDSTALLHQIYIASITRNALIHRRKVALTLSTMPKDKLCTLTGVCRQSTLSTDFEWMQRMNGMD